MTLLNETCLNEQKRLMRKVVIGLSWLREQDLCHKIIEGSLHCPLESIYSRSNMNTDLNTSGLIFDYYLEPREKYVYRSKDSHGDGYYWAHYEDIHTEIGPIDSDTLKAWLDRFVDLVGKDEAFILLKDVGELEPKIESKQILMNH